MSLTNSADPEKSDLRSTLFASISLNDYISKTEKVTKIFCFDPLRPSQHFSLVGTGYPVLDQK